MAYHMSKHLDPYENLMNAIVYSAAMDYRKALKRLTKNNRNTGAEMEAESIEKFFLSAWYEALTDVDGQYLLDRLNREFPYLVRIRLDEHKVK